MNTIEEPESRRRRRGVRGERIRRTIAALALLLAPGGASAADGDADHSFGLFGRTVSTAGTARALVARGDGSLRVAFDWAFHVGVLALHANGSVDESFGDDGIATIIMPIGAVTPNYPVAIFERPNGKLLVVANTDDLQSVALVQLTAGGDLDPDFATGGIRYVNPGPSRNAAYGAALQDDGFVVFVGECSDCGSTTGADTWIGRYSDTGGGDPAFGTNGKVVFDAVEGDTDNDSGSAVAIDELGRIVVAGSVRLNADQRPYVARRRASDGAADVTFAGDGVFTLTTLFEQQATDVAVEPASRRPVVATGRRSTFSAPEQCAIVRLTNSGALDTSFDGDGIATMTLEDGSNLHALQIQSDGRIVAVGSINAASDPVEGFLLARLLPDGTLDDSFSGDGLRRVEFDLEPDGRDAATAATLSGGKLVVAGFASDEDGNQVALLRTLNSLILADDFERRTTSAWSAVTP